MSSTMNRNQWNLRIAALVLASTFCVGGLVSAQEESDVFSDQADDDQISTVDLFESELEDDALDATEGFESESASELPPSQSEGAAASPDLGAPSRQPVIQEQLPESLAIPEGSNEIVSGAGLDGADLKMELIRERYPNGKVKVEREVTQDKDENYINHGRWVMYDETGNEIIKGSYRFGERDGPWFRWYAAEEVKLFQSAPFNSYNGPFKSEATFIDGTLNGNWRFSDTTDRTIANWAFVDGRRNGESKWFFPNGQLMRSISYQGGELNGPLAEYDASGQEVVRVEYLNGRRSEKVVKYHDKDSRQKRLEGKILRARLSLKKPDEWWTVQLASYNREGKDQKHGEWTAWYPNGQKRMEGEYQFNEPSGKFTWWHQNGQRSLVASYMAGKKANIWVWWHANGQKAIQGNYLNGSPSSRWTWWKDDGKVSHRVDYGAGGGSQVVETLPNGVIPPGSTIRSGSNQRFYYRQ